MGHGIRGRARLHIASRIAASLLGGYAFVWAFITFAIAVRRRKTITGSTRYSTDLDMRRLPRSPALLPLASHFFLHHEHRLPFSAGTAGGFAHRGE